jgi:hypothetical protein
MWDWKVRDSAHVSLCRCTGAVRALPFALGRKSEQPGSNAGNGSDCSRSAPLEDPHNLRIGPVKSSEWTRLADGALFFGLALLRIYDDGEFWTAGISNVGVPARSIEIVLK